ncbi:dipeptidyl peptidase [Cladorrhinum sp. PSN332]|nr:dipeptidyl peptidase [Cladorrhinum sp. PSN332]
MADETCRQAAWHGSRIVLQQTSPESECIFDFILELHKACEGQWSKLANEDGVGREDVESFLDYAGQFLAHLDHRPLLAAAPNSLGFPGPGTQSTYYPGPEAITKDEITAIAEIMEKNSIEAENTRLSKRIEGDAPVFHILRASAETSPVTTEFPGGDHGLIVCVAPRDHAAELSRVCAALQKAAKDASNGTQVKVLNEYIESFTTGSTEAHRRSQKTWVTDLPPSIESIFGFVEPYRDPYGVRAEWEGIVSISDPDETRKLAGLVNDSAKASLFQAPDFTIVHGESILSLGEALMFFGRQLTWAALQYSDIRETCGLKNILFWNRMAIRVESHPPCRHVHPSEAEPLKSHSQMVNFVTTSIHELIGHVSGKLLSETASSVYNFDKDHPPTNPLTGRAIESWYNLGQTWAGVFGKLATTVEECRANLISYYLADEKEVLRLFGLEDEASITDFSYYVYLTIATKGIDALASFNSEDQSWGDQHARRAFAILRHLLEDGGGTITVDHPEGTLHVRVDRSKIISHGKPSLGRLLLRLHVWRCTADVKSCRELYEPLSTVDGPFETWRQTAIAAWSNESSSLVQSEPGSKIVQPNTIIEGSGRVVLKLHDAGDEGTI